MPDLLANAGGVLASHFEWMRERSGANTTTEQMLGAVRCKLEDTLTQVVELAERRDLTPRKSAPCLAVQRLADAHVAYGLYP